MQAESRLVGGVTILQLTGRFDAYAAPKIDEWLQARGSSEPTQLVVNMIGVNFLDSTALATLVRGLKRCRESGGGLHLCNMQQPVRIIFELTHLDKAFDIFGTEEDAVEAFKQD